MADAEGGRLEAAGGRLAAEVGDDEAASDRGATVAPATKLSRESGPRHARIAAGIEVIACSGFPTQIAIAGVLALAGVQPFDARGRLSVAYVFGLSVVDAILLVGLVAWFLRLHGEDVRRVLLGSRPLLSESLLGLLQLPIIFFLVVVMMAAFTRFAPWLHNVRTNPMEGLITTPADAWLFVIVAVVGGGIREEVQRAFILHRFEQYLGGAWVGLVLFSLVFASGHIIQGRDVALTTGALGLFWGVVYLGRRSIASAVVSHSCFNALEIARFALRA